MDSVVKPSMDRPVLCRNPAAVCSGMVKKRQLATTSPGKVPKRAQQVLDRSESLMEVRRAVAANVKWILDNSSAEGSIPKMHRETGLAPNTIKRILAAANGVTIDTLAVIADQYGIPMVRLFSGLTEKDQSMIRMFASMKQDISKLQARVGP